MVTHNPLHGSGQADFPHPALASGDDAKSLEGIGVIGADRGQPAVDEASHPFPENPTVLATPTQDVVPETADLETKQPQCGQVHRDSLVAEVPVDHRTQPL